jgi:hypothetical protein
MAQVIESMRKRLGAAVTGMREDLAKEAGSGDPAEIVDAATLLKETVDLHAKYAGAGHDSTKVSIRATGNDAITGYRLERAGNGFLLSELRSGTAPFRIERAIYEATAKVLQQAPDDGLLVEELLRRVGQEIGRPVPDYAARVALRFWQRLDPPTVIRDRGRYRPATAGNFYNAAADVWLRLPHN